MATIGQLHLQQVFEGGLALELGGHVVVEHTHAAARPDACDEDGFACNSGSARLSAMAAATRASSGALAA